MKDDSLHAKHTKLVLDMADSQGVDLAELIMQADISMDEMEEAVAKCMGCKSPEDCRQRLAMHEDSLSLPEYCQNGDMFDMLKQR